MAAHILTNDKHFVRKSHTICIRTILSFPSALLLFEVSSVTLQRCQNYNYITKISFFIFRFPCIGVRLPAVIKTLIENNLFACLEMKESLKIR